jgi:hypothetical protein
MSLVASRALSRSVGDAPSKDLQRDQTRCGCHRHRHPWEHLKAVGAGHDLDSGASKQQVRYDIGAFACQPDT